MIPIDSEEFGYSDIAAEIREQILSGELQPGARVPSIVDLASHYGVAKETANRALQVLRRQGLVIGVRGKPGKVRMPPERVVVKIERGSDVEFRMPTRVEARTMELGEGVMLAVVTYGQTTTVYACDRTKLRFR